MELDMTKGKPMGLMLRFLIPVAIGNIFQQLYNTVDSIIVGRFVGVGALAAVGSTGTIMFLILGFLSGLTSGFTVLVSQRFGAGDIKGMKRAVGNAALLAVIVSAVMTFFSMVFMKQLLTLMNTPADIYQDAYDYIIVICGGICCNVLYNMMAAVLRAVGNSKVPLYFLLVSVVLNCGLDLFLIIVWDMGVAGAAWATIISQGVSGVLCLFYVYKKMEILHPGKGNWKLEHTLSMQQLAIGIPMALQFSITAVGAIILQSALNLLGSVMVAAYTAASKVEQVVTQPFLAMGATMATYSAQNMGIADIKRIRKGVTAANLMTIVYAVVIGVLMATVLVSVVPVFVTGDNVQAVVDAAAIYMRISALFYIPLGLIFVFRNVLQGAGYGFLPMMGGVVELVCRTVFAFLAAYHHSYTGVCIANVSAWVGAGFFLLAVYLYKMKRIETRLQRPDPSVHGV